MPSLLTTSSIIGLDAHAVSVEADISPGMPAFCVVGLPDASVQEARERVKSAMKLSGFSFPRTHVTVNLAPADLRKSGTAFDVPIALAILCANGDIPPLPSTTLCVGELGLDGALRPVPGVLPTAMLAAQAGYEELIVPAKNADEAALVPNIRVRPAQTLIEIIQHIQNVSPLAIHPTRHLLIPDHTLMAPDMSAIRGQEFARRALEIAAAGGHNILLEGPPGSGKTLLARSFPGILPRLTPEEALEVSRIHSVAGTLPSQGYVSERIFRAPHHSASGAALVGGGAQPRPGEISLAHRGVLFLDELPEFGRHVLEHLRQPLEDGIIAVSRAQGTIHFPARFVLIAAMNPCPCGFATDPDRACSCTPLQREKYSKKISGPLLDRIDLLIEVPKVPTAQLSDLEPGETSASIRARVQAARDIQANRYASLHIQSNAELSSDQVRRLIIPTPDGRSLLAKATDRLKLSARAYFRILRVARTIADLDHAEDVTETHISEAIQYRQRQDSLLN